MELVVITLESEPWEFFSHYGNLGVIFRARFANYRIRTSMYHICVYNQAVRCCAVNGLNSGAGTGIDLNLGNADLGYAGLAGIHIVVDHDSAGSAALGKSSAITA